MKNSGRYLIVMTALSLLVSAIFGCSKSVKRPIVEWTKAQKIAGKEQRLSHISGLAVDDKFIYVTMGGTIADQNEGMSGLRKVALDSGAITELDNNLPQSDYGGLAIDKDFVYWNTTGKILRVSKGGGKPEVVASENVGMGIDIAVDNEKVYWANHGYYSPNTPSRPSPIYAVLKQGGKVEIFADQQNIPHNLVVDEKFVYWVTPTSILKQAKSGGEPQVLYQASGKEGVDELAQDSENLYFGFRGAGKSRWALSKISKQGGEPQILVKTYSAKAIAIDETNIYFFDEDGLTKDVFCKVSKNGDEVIKLDTGYASGVITQSKTHVYLSSLDDIHSFSK
jgi:hypothetical protein